MNPLHMAMVGVAGLFLALTSALWLQTKRLEVAETKVAAQLMLEQATARRWEATSVELQRELGACQSHWRDALGEAERAAANAYKQQAEAEKRLTDFQRRYAQRPQTCSAALAQLDVVCTSLGGY
jgi:hypothetical protein